MNSFIPGIESFLDKRLSADEFSVTADSGRVLVAGYGFHAETNSGATLPDRNASPRAAILYADGFDAAPVTEDDESEMHLGLLESRKIFRALVAGFGGRFACYAGNFIIAEFQNVETALQCAVNVQVALTGRNACAQSGHRIRYRLGIEVGKTASAYTSQSGRAIDLVAELDRGVHPGAIYISDLAREQLRRKPMLRFISMGRRQAHDSGEALEAYWIEMDRSMLVPGVEARKRASTSISGQRQN